MADLSVTPVATAIKPQPNMSLSDMVNMARAAQAYQQEQQVNPLLLQQQRQATRTGQIALGVEEQKDLERRNWQTFSSNPNNLMTDGRIDMDKINNKVLEIAPLMGGEIIQKFSTLAKAQTDAESAKQNLTNETKSMVGQVFNLYGKAGIKEKQPYFDALDDLAARDPNNKNLKKLVESYKTTLKTLPEGANIPQIAITSAQTLLTIQQQEAAFTPTAGTVNLGTEIKPTVTRPSVGGQEPSIKVGVAPIAETQITPAQMEVPAGINQITGLPQVEKYDKSGRFLGVFDVQPTGQQTQTGEPGDRKLTPSPTIPAGESAESGKLYQGQIIESREKSIPAKTALTSLDAVIKYLPLAQTGKSSEAIAGLQSVLGNIAGSKPEEIAAAARDIIDKNIKELALQKNIALGGKFAASLETAEASLANASKNPTAIAKSMEQLRPLLQHVVNYEQGLRRAVEKSPEKQFVKPKFDAAINDAFDPQAIMMNNAFKSGGAKGVKKYVEENKINLRDQQELIKKLEKYNSLINGNL